MAIVNSDFLAGVLENFQATFNRRFPAAVANQLWPQLTMRVNSDTEQESHEWFGTVPPMRDRTQRRQRLDLGRQAVGSFGGGRTHRASHDQPGGRGGV